MNITGSAGVLAKNNYTASGAFSLGGGAYPDALNSGNYAGGRGLELNASKAWTGETSAVGGGASHTHTVTAKETFYI